MPLASMVNGGLQFTAGLAAGFGAFLPELLLALPDDDFPAGSSGASSSSGGAGGRSVT